MNKEESVMIRIKKSLKKDLKVFAAEKEKSISDIIEEIYNEYKLSLVSRALDSKKK